MSTRARVVAAALLAGTVLAGPLAAGTVLVYQDDEPPGNRMTISFQADHLRVDFGQHAMLFHGATSQTELDLPAKRYTEVIEKASKLPHAGSPERPLPFYRHAGERVRLGVYLTEYYQVLAEGRRVMDLWVADPAQLHVEPADTVIFPALRKRLADVPLFSEVQYLAGDGAPAGVPIKLVLYAPGGKASSLQLTHAAQESLPPSTFEVPADFVKSPPRPR